MASIRPAGGTARSRFLLRIRRGRGVDSLSICVEDRSRNTVLFDWHGAEARCLLESHDLLRRRAMGQHNGNTGIPISKTSIWHLALHVAAIRCLLNRSLAEDVRDRGSAGSEPAAPALLDDGLYDGLSLRVLRLLRADRCNALSVHDITCLLALEGFTCTPTCIRQALDDLLRWGYVSRTTGDVDDAMFAPAFRASTLQRARRIDPAPARQAMRPAQFVHGIT